MIDLHCHILPGIDDGPESIEASVFLAHEAAVDGIETVAATPHLREDYPAVRLEELARRTEEVQAALQAEGYSLKVVAGAEVDLVLSMDASDDDLRLASYGQLGKYVLVETPYGPLTSNFEQLLFDRFMGRGLRVLLAHPERNPTLQADPDRVSELVRTGVLLQVTAASLASREGRSRSRKLARALVKEGIAHVIASDSHGPGIARAPLSAGVAEAERLAPGGRGQWMVTDAPAAILAGEPLPEPPPLERRGRMFGLPFRRS